MLIAPRASQAAPASTHGTVNVHVHDDYYHPAGAFIVGTGTDHTLAKATCEVPNPPSSCDAVIHAGDSITWVAPAPLAANPHSVTECTDNTFSVCGGGVASGNPIDDSGVRAAPSPGPSGWPYGPVQFNAVGTYYYRCQVHPATMRGRIVVQALPAAPQFVGGVAEIVQPHAHHAGSQSDEGGAMTVPIVITVAAGMMMLTPGGFVAWRRFRRT